MSEENKDGKTVRDLKPEKDPKGGFIGPEPPVGGGDTKGFNVDKGKNPNPLPPQAELN